MLPKAILFDLDDTIISFDGAADLAWEESCNLFVKSGNITFDGKTLLESINKVRRWYWGDTERHRIGRMDIVKARREIVRMALNELGFFDDISAYNMADSYSKLQEELISLFPDSIDILEKLKTLRIRMVLITNGTSEKQRAKINRFCLADFFEFCLIEEELGVGKPNPRVFEIALEKLGLRADEVWMVGDNLVWDIDAPQKVGIFAIWNDFRNKGLPKDSTIVPDRIINSISELIV